MKAIIRNITGILALGFFLIASLNAQSDRLTGTVYDENGIPMSGVYVTLVEPGMGSTTTEEGVYNFVGITDPYCNQVLTLQVTLPTYFGTTVQYLEDCNGGIQTVNIFLVSDRAPIMVTNNEDSGPGSLRQAIADANANPGKDYIHFDVPDIWMVYIQPVNALPPITDEVVINGFSQPGSQMNTNPAGSGFSTKLQVVLDGSSAGTGAAGLNITADNCEIKGLNISHFGREGLNISSDFNGISDCFIGTDSLGNNGYGNVWYGIYLTGSNSNLIQRCIISGNGNESGGHGLYFADESSMNLVYGNLIGTDLSGMFPLTNKSTGIMIGAGSGNTIGGNDIGMRNIIFGGLTISGGSDNRVINNYLGPDITGLSSIGPGIDSYGVAIGYNAFDNEVGPNNVISGNKANGVLITGENNYRNRVFGNYIGVAADGNTPMPNEQVNVYLSNHASSNRIGGLTADSANVISGGISDGILIRDASVTGNAVLGNLIGTNASGTTAVPNGSDGIVIESGAYDNTIKNNLISGNVENGIYISGLESSGNLVIGNLIGTNADASTAVPNSDGIRVRDAVNTIIGGESDAERNIISGNKNEGIRLYDNATGTQIINNYIGLDITGTQALGNAANGIMLSSGSHHNYIAQGNVISGNALSGLYFADSATSNNRVFGNYIGLAVDGVTPLGNQGSNIFIENASNNKIGGLTADSANVISASINDHGIQLTGPSSIGNIIVGNRIGTNADGDQALGNMWQGVEINDGASYNVIGPGNLISGNSGFGIKIEIGLPHDNKILSNFIGVTASGDALLSNRDDGVHIHSSYANEINGNVICGAGIGSVGNNGIEIYGIDAHDNIISNNYIGTNALSGTNLGNGFNGVHIAREAHHNSIGPNNIICNNHGSGIRIDSEETVSADSTLIFQNHIGTDLNGNSDLGNGAYGIEIRGNSRLTTVGPDNIIAGSTYSGIYIENTGSTGTMIFQNIIGTDNLNSTGIGNGEFGIILDDHVTLTTIGPGNVVSGNGVGILIQNGSSENTIIGNRVGTTIDGMDALGNEGIGVMIQDSPNNLIGGTEPEDRNLFSGNGMEGLGIAFAASSGNRVIGNYIGTDATGQALLQNGSGDFGINGAPNNVIGGLNPGERNVIADMSIENPGAKWNIVVGNYIGIKADGSGPLSQEYYGAGVFISETSDNTVGPGNVISGLDRGVHIHVPPGGETDSTARNKIIGNYIGTNPDGTSGISNRVGIFIDGATATSIGGISAAERNIISGSDEIGIQLDRSASETHIENNYIGTGIDGTQQIPNGTGISIGPDSHDNYIGNGTSEGGNLISYNGSGIGLGGEQDHVLGNVIRGHSVDGIFIVGDSNTIGGAAIEDRNYFYGNNNGIRIFPDRSFNHIEGNVLGTDTVGLEDKTEGYNGIAISGSDNTVKNNLISGYEHQGVLVTRWNPESNIPQRNRIEQNRVGLALNGDNFIPNGHGISLNSTTDNLIIGNEVAGNNWNGIALRDDQGAVSINNLISQNLVYGNGGIGIDLISDGPTPNDASPDADEGPNHLQNFPVLVSVGFGIGTVSVTGTLHSEAGKLFILEFFSSFAGDPSTYGEGEIYLGSDTVETDGNGDAVFDCTLPIVNYGAQIITATATDEDGNTSEFSQVIGQAPLLVTNTDDSGPGSLRQAIQDANTNTGKDYIHFNIPGTQVHTIKPSTALPPVTDTLVINGFSQSGSMWNTNAPGQGFNTEPKIELDGSDPGDPATGLVVNANGCEISGLIINRFSSLGIALGGDNNSVNECFIGTDSLGIQSSDYGNGVYGIEIYEANYNEIRNCLISSNGGDEQNPGILISGGSTLNQVTGNLIGTDISGSLPLPNSGSGINITDSPGNIIGGDSAEYRNVIFDGLQIGGEATTGNKIIGNYFGPDVSGLDTIDQGRGIVVGGGANHNEIGPDNVISANGNYGLLLMDSTTCFNRIFGNIFGLAADGSTRMGNRNNNIVIQNAPHNRIGGLTSDSTNVISGSLENGLMMWGDSATGNQIVGNYFGTNASGDQAVGNTQHGIMIAGGSYNVVGPNNVISGNGNRGIQIYHITAINNQIINNLFGTDASGRQPLDNVQSDIYITNAPGTLIDGNTICGSGAGQPGGPGIELLGTDTRNTIISNNYIGTNASGDQGLGNGSVGIFAFMGASNNYIGPNNVISGNGGGIHFEGEGTDSTSIFGNYIGTNHDNADSLGNIYAGIDITLNSTDNTIGPENVISGNGEAGIQISGDSSIRNKIVGNLIGTTIDGMGAMGNGTMGIHMSAPFNTIGGYLAEERNVISDNGYVGIEVGSNDGSGNCIIVGNYIGTDITGNGALLNQGGGLSLNNSTSNLVGGLEPGARNVIGSMGIGNLAATNNRVIGNYIGIRADGSGAINDTVPRAGILISDAADNTIGPGNVISGVSEGIMVTEYFGVDTVYTVNNKIFGNFIGTNPVGTFAIHNGVGIQIEAKRNLIGGYTEEERNIISGNDIGVNIFGEEADSNIVVGNYIGTDYLGESAIPNANGVWITNGNDNMIGGVTEEARNVISGNGDNGIWIQGNGPLIADGNKVQGNFIGLAANGTDPLGNGGFGVKINAAAGNLIGGPEPKHRNIVSANGTPGMNRFGIYVELENSGIGNTIQGNYVGTDVTGMHDVGNVSAGILIANASNIKILDNLVSGNNGGGISLWQGKPVEPALNYGHIISGNIIGLNADASGMLGNDYNGIAIAGASNNIIGGERPEEANIIGGNDASGLLLSWEAYDNIVLGNYIGIEPISGNAIPNETGIQIDSSANNNVIGDFFDHGNFIAYNTTAGVKIGSDNNALFGNTIWENGTDGVQIYGDSFTETGNNTLSQNLIFDNGGIGIDLNADGPTLNDDVLDIDEGPNNLQNYPVLDSIKFLEGKVVVTGRLHTKSDSTYILEFFSSGVADNTSYGEGEYYLGSDTVITDGSGNALFRDTLVTKGFGAEVITATARDLDGNTSEFSQVIGGVIDQVLTDMPFRYKLNSDGLPTVPLADYQNAIQNAFQTWDDIPTAEIEMEYAGDTTAKYASASDSLNLISFQDDHFPFPKGVLAITAKTLEISAGGTLAEIVDADIVFNPAYITDVYHPFAILEEGDNDTMSFDIETVASHEAGHILGMIHSPVYFAKMFFMLGYGTSARDLALDDIAWAGYRYPNENFGQNLGFISGRITYGDLGDPEDPSTHPPVAGAVVLAVSVDTLDQEMFHAYTDADGYYRIPIYMDGMASEDYNVYIQPLDGDVWGTALYPENISPYIYSHTIYTDFPEEFYNFPDGPFEGRNEFSTISVLAGDTVEGIDLITNRDTIPPEVIGVYPEDGGTDVAFSPTLVLKFSEPVDIHSFVDTTCFLESSGDTIEGDFTILADSTHIMLMKPVEALQYSTTYTLHIDAITDLKDNALKVPYTSSFTTREPDTDAPIVYDVIPADGTDQVDVVKPVKIFFSESMNKSSVESSFLLITTGNETVEGTFSWDVANKEMTYSPDYSLQEGTDYIISLSTLATDLSGNALEEGDEFTFSTVDMAAPQILYLGPADGDTDITVETPVAVKVSEPLDVSTITPTSFFLTGPDGKVQGTYEYLDDNRNLIFRPDQPLLFDTPYTITLTSDISDKSNPSENLEDTEATFRTAPYEKIPHILYMEPPFGAVGAKTTIVGSGFDPVPWNNLVWFDGVAAYATKSTLESVTVLVPYGADDGPVTVNVNGNDADNSFDFDVVPPNTDPSYSVIASATTGSRTRAVVINPDAGYAYVTNWGDNTVTPLDISGLIPIPEDDIPVGVEPMDIDLNPEGTLAYVTNFLSNTVSVIGTQLGGTGYHQEIKQIPVGYHPYGVAVSSDRKVYVANNESEYVSVIDVDPNSGGFDHVIANLKTGTTNRSIVVTPDAGLVLVTGDDGVKILDRYPNSPTFNQVIATASAGSTTRHITITPDAALALATTADGVILIIDIYQPPGTQFGSVIASVKTGTTARNITISPDAQYVYITNPDDNTVSVYQLDYSIVPGYGASLSYPKGLILLATIEVSEEPYAIAGHPNSEYILVTHDTDEGGVTKVGVSRGTADLIRTLDQLISSVTKALEDGLIPEKYAARLLEDLEIVRDRIEGEQLASALDKINTFIKRLQRYIDAGGIPVDLGNAWLEAAYRIRDQIEKDIEAQYDNLKSSGGSGSGTGSSGDETSDALRDYQINRLLNLEIRPNPLNTFTQINFEIPELENRDIPVSLRVYNTSGQVVKSLVQMHMEPGRYTVLWNGDLDQGGQVTNGLYLLELRIPGHRQTITLSVVK